MPRLPLPLRVAAGLAATTVQEVLALPATVVSLPVTAISQVLQTYMRAQQHITSLAIRGDEVLGFLSPGEEAPEWATFDDDLDDEPAPPARASRSSGRFALYSQVPADLDAPTPLDAARQARAAAVAEAAPAAPLPGYDAMTLAQLRARLRQLSLVELEDLLLHERARQARAPFLTMLSNRIASVRAQ